MPFCERRCEYCSFNTAPLAPEALARYLGALHREIDLLAALPWADRVTLSTVFFGGGTPSVLATEEMSAILARVGARFRVEEGAEVTVECNPESVTRGKIEGYLAAGVNRVSLGVQALDDAILQRIGRLHGARRARAAFDETRAAGCANVSVDLMYGLPGLDGDEWARGVGAVLDWAPDHLSAYGLTLDAGSLWGASGVEGLPPEGTVVEQYWALARAAAARGYEHYEISNYARPGSRSRHNQIYWRAAEYLACGPGGCGFVGDVRYGNARAVPRYCAALETAALPIDSFERLTPPQRMAERLILGLRTTDGVPATLLAERAAGDEALGRRLATWREHALLLDAGDRVRLSEAGFLVSDALFVEIL